MAHGIGGTRDSGLLPFAEAFAEAGLDALVLRSGEATAFQTKEVLDAMRRDSGIELGSLRVDGGMVRNDLLMQFDYPDANVHSEKRSATTTAVQKLFVLNSDFMQEQAAAMAARVRALQNDEEAQVRAAYALALGRNPNQREQTIGVEFLHRWSNQPDQALTELCKLILNLNEFVYVD